MIDNLFEIANEIVKQVDIVEVASHYIKVEKCGRNYQALCPFHDDKKLGNFYLNKDKGIFKCFSCGKSGNAITFVQSIEHIPFKEAVLKTAELIGYNNERLNNFVSSKPSISEHDQKLFNCLEEICQFYENSLFFSKDEAAVDALNYLHNRGLDDETIKHFRIGYCQRNGENIVEFLRSKGYSITIISETGIVNINKTPFRDSNAGRISFPIADKDGRVVGFSCRKFREDDTSNAKYINTSATSLFNKGNILYNYNNAINEARKVGYVYLLEGFMDVIACYRVGIKSAIALMGTALTRDNLQHLRFMKSQIRLCLDLDNPGQLNALNISNLFDEANIDYKIVNNDVDFSEKDTDEILKAYGDEKLRSYLGDLKNKGEWLLVYLSKHLNLKTLDGKKKMVNSFIPYLASLANLLDYEYYLNSLSRVSGFDASIIEKAVNKYKGKLDKKDEVAYTNLTTSNSTSKKDNPFTKLKLAEKQIVSYMLENKDAVDKYEIKLGYFVDSNYKEIANLIEEFINRINSANEYNVKNLIVFLDSDECKFLNKDLIRDEIANLALEYNKFPPYSEAHFTDIVNTINEEKENNLAIDTYKLNIKSNKSELEQAKYAKTLLSKRKFLIDENDKKRRN